MSIAGDYQARALQTGFVVQRFWHSLKPRLIERVCPPPAGGRVLDVGCGSGVIANHLARRAAFVDAVDGNPAAVAYARAHAARDNMAFHLAQVDSLPLPEGSFDRIYCLELIEHLYEHQVRALLVQLGKLLAQSGELLITTPNYASMWPVIEWCMDAFHLAPRMKDDQHVSKWTRRRLRALGRETGLAEVQIGRFSGAAPFLSVLSWHLACAIDAAETRIGSPFGNLLFGIWRRDAR